MLRVAFLNQLLPNLVPVSGHERLRAALGAFAGILVTGIVTAAAVGSDAGTPLLGYNGGVDWGGVAIDAEKGIMITNYNNMPNYNQLVPREEVEAAGVLPITDPNYDAEAGGGSHGSLSPQAETPYGIRVNAGWRVPFTGLLCSEPPYGGIAAIDLNTREVLWDRPFGTARKNGPFGVPSMLPIPIGTPNNGGGVITASGLFFIAAATDDILRAIDIETGEEVWQVTLPAGGQATPMTYEANASRSWSSMPAGTTSWRPRSATTSSPMRCRPQAANPPKRRSHDYRAPLPGSALSTPLWMAVTNVGLFFRHELCDSAAIARNPSRAIDFRSAAAKIPHSWSR